MVTNMNKIYIIGPVGSGKTTLATNLSKKLNIRMYELDKIIWDDDNGNIKRNDKEISKLFDNILKEKSWIIEDVGRIEFKKGIKEADIVYYLNLKSCVIYQRCILRWFKQLLKIEKYNYKPTVKSLLQMLKWAKKDIKNKNQKINYIKSNTKNYKIINSKEIMKLNFRGVII